MRCAWLLILGIASAIFAQTTAANPPDAPNHTQGALHAPSHIRFEDATGKGRHALHPQHRVRQEEFAAGGHSFRLRGIGASIGRMEVTAAEFDGDCLDDIYVADDSARFATPQGTSPIFPSPRLQRTIMCSASIFRAAISGLRPQRF